MEMAAQRLAGRRFGVRCNGILKVEDHRISVQSRRLQERTFLVGRNIKNAAQRNFVDSHRQTVLLHHQTTPRR